MQQVYHYGLLGGTERLQKEGMAVQFPWGTRYSMRWEQRQILTFH